MSELQVFAEKVCKMDNGSVVVVCTDKFEVFTQKQFMQAYSEKKVAIEKVLDIRAFDEQKEIRLMRDYVSSAFAMYDIEDSVMKESGYDQFVDYQYLDIDCKKSKELDGEVYATGGGKYLYPYDYGEETKAKIVNYVKYDENGQSMLMAWRLAGFEEGRAM